MGDGPQTHRAQNKSHGAEVSESPGLHAFTVWTGDLVTTQGVGAGGLWAQERTQEDLAGSLHLHVRRPHTQGCCGQGKPAGGERKKCVSGLRSNLFLMIFT